jgi:hypothetical protein
LFQAVDGVSMGVLSKKDSRCNAAPAPVTLPPAPAAIGLEVVEEKQQLRLSGMAAAAALT